MLQNSSKTQHPCRRQQHKVQRRGKTKDAKEAPTPQTDCKGFTCKVCTFTQSRSHRPEGWCCSPFSTGTSEEKVPVWKVRRNQMPWLLGQHFLLSDRFPSTRPPHWCHLSSTCGARLPFAITPCSAAADSPTDSCHRRRIKGLTCKLFLKSIAR